MFLVAGSYEGFIWGFNLKPWIHNPHQTLTLSPLFSYPSHLSQIKSVAISGAVVASGGTDNTIHIYNLNALSCLGSLHDHTSTITALSFYTPPHLNFPRNLISADADGTVHIYDADSLDLLRDFSAHTRDVNDLALHPSGKVALSVGRDECLAVLDLVGGGRRFCCRLGREARLVRYDLSGDKFVMAFDEMASVHDAEDARLLFEFQNQKRILCVEPGENGLLHTGGEDRNITAWDTNSGKVAYCIEDAHKTRVKGIVTLTKHGCSGDGDEPHLVASASSDGVIRVWDDRMATGGKPNPVAETNTKSRLTCLAGSSIKNVK